MMSPRCIRLVLDAVQDRTTHHLTFGPVLVVLILSPGVFIKRYHLAGGHHVGDFMVTQEPSLLIQLHPLNVNRSQK